MEKIDFARERIEEEFENKTGTLDLSNCGLFEIPEEVFEMEWLITLKLSENLWEYDEQLDKWFRTTETPINPNEISSIPEMISSLNKLENLYLGNNTNISARPIQNLDIISNLVSLKQLNLNGQEIFELDFLQNLKKLEFLDLSKNFISSTKNLNKLNGLKFLDISSNNIDLFNFTLTSKNLKYLILENSHSPIQQKASISINIIPVKLTDNFSVPKELIQLNLANNVIYVIDPLRKIRKLKHLDLNRNHIPTLFPILQFENLETINVNFNPITDCPKEIYQTNDLSQIKAYFSRQKINTEQNVIVPKNLPSSPKVKNKKSTAKTNIKKNLKPKSIHDVKLIFVGNSGAGKTQLAQYLKTGEYTDIRDSTHGIQLNRWVCHDDTSDAFSHLDNKLVVNNWDFGGQEYYHGTFRLFLSNKAVYVLLWEDATNINDYLDTPINEKEREKLQHFHYEYWLDNIRHLAADSKIIIVQNKIDLTDKNGESVKQRIDSKIMKQYDIHSDHYISLREAAGENQKFKRGFDVFCDDLGECLEDAIETDKHAVWLAVKDAIIDLKNDNQKNPFLKYVKEEQYILIKDFEKAALTIEKTFDKNELYTLPRWMHNTGVVIYFGENEILKDKIFLNPDWVSQGIYNILDKTIWKNKGAFAKEDILDAGKTEDFLQFMQEMDIIFENPELPGHYIAPQYLPDTHPIEDLYNIAVGRLDNNAISIRLPLFYFRKALHRMVFLYSHKPEIQTKYYWKNGIIFKHGETIETTILIKGQLDPNDPKHGQLILGVENNENSGYTLKAFFTEILECISDINTTNSHPKYDFRSEGWTDIQDLPSWLKAMDISLDGNYFVNYLDLCKKNQDGEIYIFSTKKETEQPIIEPNEPATSSSTLPNDIKRFRIHDFQYFLDKRAKKPLKVFISYSHNDTALVNRFKNHLAPLKKAQKIETWIDQEILPGTRWDEEIQVKLDDSDITLFLLSPDFNASTYIWEKEINRAFENQKNDPSKIIIPILLRPCDFVSLDHFPQLEIIPKDEQEKLIPITQWDNEDEAFVQVINDIKNRIGKMKR